MIRNHLETGNLDLVGLERMIVKFIEKRYCCKYTGGLSVEKKGSRYCLKLDLDNQLIPLWICGEFNTDEEFLCFIFLQIVDRQLQMTGHYKVHVEHGRKKGS